MGTTIADIARLAGVSKTTVSRVLNARPDVDEETALRVRQVVTETNYSPSARAVGLARGRAQAVGMLVPSLTWPWISDVLQGAIDVLEANGYGLLLYTSSRGEESLAKFTAQVAANSFDGLLVIEPPNTIDYIADLHAKGLPVVLIDDRGSHPNFPSVATTNFAGGAQAAEHLLSTGRHNLAMISGPAAYGCTRDRRAGFLQAARDIGVPNSVLGGAESDFTERGGHTAALQLLATDPKIDGIFAHNDLMAIGVMRALRESGRRVGEDVAVVGFDDIPMAAHTEPSLTTIRQPAAEMAAAAAQALLDRLGGAPELESLVLDTSLVVRRSAPGTSTP